LSYGPPRGTKVRKIRVKSLSKRVAHAILEEGHILNYSHY